jgi:hypothetical protein
MSTQTENSSTSNILSSSTGNTQTTELPSSTTTPYTYPCIRDIAIAIDFSDSIDNNTLIGVIDIIE